MTNFTPIYKDVTTEFIYLVLIAIIAVKPRRLEEDEKRNKEGDIQIYNTIQITKSSSALIQHG